jgi:hypothetical protein
MDYLAQVLQLRITEGFWNVSMMGLVSCKRIGLIKEKLISPESHTLTLGGDKVKKLFRQIMKRGNFTLINI